MRHRRALLVSFQSPLSHSNSVLSSLSLSLSLSLCAFLSCLSSFIQFRASPLFFHRLAILIGDRWRRHRRSVPRLFGVSFSFSFLKSTVFVCRSSTWLDRRRGALSRKRRPAAPSASDVVPSPPPGPRRRHGDRRPRRPPSPWRPVRSAH